MEINRAILGDCLEVMKDIPDGSIDMILCDLPYGVTSCRWDSCIPLDLLWKQYKRITKDTSVIVLFGTEPFATYLRISNIDMYKYDIIWVKNRPTNFIHAKNMPLRQHENICIFSKGSIQHKSHDKGTRMKYNPQGIAILNKIRKTSKNQFGTIAGKRKSHKEYFLTEYENYPTSVLYYRKDNENYHPSQKPVALCEYLINTYTDENNIVLDNAAGSGTTGLACINTNRNYILIEKDKDYYDIILKRIEQEREKVGLYAKCAV